MNCEKCGQKTRVVYTAQCANHVHRRRVCPTCKTKFSTDEIVVQEGASGTGSNARITKYVRKP